MSELAKMEAELSHLGKLMSQLDMKGQNLDIKLASNEDKLVHVEQILE
jgi:hypothetical protein